MPVPSNDVEQSADPDARDDSARAENRVQHGVQFLVEVCGQKPQPHR